MSKIFKKIMIIFCLVLMFSNSIILASDQEITGSGGSGGVVESDAIDSPESWNPTASYDLDTTGTFLVTSNKIIYVLRLVGTGISIIAIIILGIKYMIGSVEEKAEYKKTFGAYILGIIFIFATTNIIAGVASLVE